MNPLYYLLLAHFFADFPLQSHTLFRYKESHWIGVLLHGCIHFSVASVLLFPLLRWKGAWIAIGAVALSHLLIDHAKLHLMRCHNVKPFLAYLGDQLLHLIIIIIAVKFYLGTLVNKLDYTLPDFYTNSSIIAYLFAMVLSTYAYDITRWMYVKGQPSSEYRRDHKMILRNSFIVTAAFVLYWVMS